MSPDELLRRYPRTTLRWLRGRLGLSQLSLAVLLNAAPTTVAGWEAGRHAISPARRLQLAAFLAPHLATDEGADFVRSLGATDAPVSDRENS